jgi:ubiquinone/menaquinone biosynthesis C-methylase UbiE
MGAGDGAFTLALRDIAGPDAHIIAIDQDARALRDLARRMEAWFPGTALQTRVADMTADLDLPLLDGIVSANALHYVEHRYQPSILRLWRRYLQPGGRLILIEYDADSGNPWVPYPFSFSSLARLAQAGGFGEPILLDSVPSRHLGRIYAALLEPNPETDHADP